MIFPQLNQPEPKKQDAKAREKARRQQQREMNDVSRFLVECCDKTKGSEELRVLHHYFTEYTKMRYPKCKKIIAPRTLMLELRSLGFVDGYNNDNNENNKLKIIYGLKMKPWISGII